MGVRDEELAVGYTDDQTEMCKNKSFCVNTLLPRSISMLAVMALYVCF